MPHHVFGIRHHGPGSARSLVQALTALQPDCILVEGPPEADSILPLAVHEQMQPPVALLIYAPDEPQRAVYYPFATFSPEWQAIRYALAQQIPVRFMDLPVGINFARDKAAEEAPAETAESGTEDSDTTAIRRDPLALLAEAAGYADSERWWEHMVEERQDSSQLFQAINEAMSALRAEVDAHSPRDPAEHEREQLREAHMRKCIRQAHKDGFQTIAVVCGAWHAPALQTLPAAKADDALLKGLPKLKTTATWVPWTHERLSNASGYGAGVDAPGWYAHIWRSSLPSPLAGEGLGKGGDGLTTRWLTQVAHTFRQQGLDISSAHIIETVRLAETLAAMRSRPLPGIAELNEAVQSVMLFGDATPMQLLHRKLLIGESLGNVPDATPQTPLQQDLAQEQKRLRLKPAASDEDLLLDLRKPTDLERSYLLRRLGILGIPWGKGGDTARGKGTFKESWRTLWQPEFAIRLIEAGFWGNTLAAAATHRLVKQAQDTQSLEQLASLAHTSLYANLPEAVDVLMQRLQTEAAVSSDILHLMQAMPELARLLRYGDVRKTSLEQVSHVVTGMVTRICIGLPNACSALNEDAAEAMFKHIQAVQEAVNLLAEDAFSEQWTQTLQTLLDQHGLHPLLAGRCCRTLLQAGILDEGESARRFGLALSTANEPAHAASWVDGFLRDSGQLLIYDETLWNLIDQWVSSLTADSFQQLLPVLRRTFATFTAPERRQMGERVKQGQAALPSVTAAANDIDETRAAAALPLVAMILGLAA
ncbi:MAG TPA: DUF5682 family protein [Candidatus Thiothrix moscowensis]|uniref:DUF5682 family protein n=1 Tax=unclassified Thiothrix TaxID=2636184 RepID=UPI0025DB8FE4|nr:MULTISPECIES: DUF5682 family protein [unclassified Thiothrix]HRJ52094.1 DUF5682 family protein [Candidatus Thiothrix moscowensis]HRJ92395.1 DUF5682 family protein [Candidatus Thiothrix moscowensis]